MLIRLFGMAIMRMCPVAERATGRAATCKEVWVMTEYDHRYLCKMSYDYSDEEYGFWEFYINSDEVDVDFNRIYKMADNYREGDCGSAGVTVHIDGTRIDFG